MLFSGYGAQASTAIDPADLDRCLENLVALGFTHAELPAFAWGIWSDYGIIEPQLARFTRVTDKWRDKLNYTVHGPFAFINIGRDRPDLLGKLLRAAMQTTKAFGAELLVYDTLSFATPWPEGGLAALQNEIAIVRGHIQEVADEVAAWGGKVAIETNHDDSFSGLPKELANQINLIDRDNVGICIDTGHSLMSSMQFGWDWIEGMATLAPNAIHFHLDDNFGLKITDAIRQTGISGARLFEMGYGDMHLPPGWGVVPFDRLFAEVEFPQHPILMTEIPYDRYYDVLPDVFERLHEWSAAHTN